jgi:hypothetical protein
MNASGTQNFHIMKQFVFSLNLTTQEYLQYYRGSVDKVVAQCIDGRTVQFPAGLLAPHVTSWGVRGEFVLTCDEDRKGAQLMRRQSHAMAAA